jgi:hypothetical protein
MLKCLIGIPYGRDAVLSFRPRGELNCAADFIAIGFFLVALGHIYSVSKLIAKRRTAGYGSHVPLQELLPAFVICNPVPAP